MAKRRQTQAQKQLAAAQAAARHFHLVDCPHPGHWVDTERGVVRCPCWKAAQHAAEILRQAQEAQG